MDKNRWILVGIGAVLVVLLIYALFALKGCGDDDRDIKYDNVQPQTEGMIVDGSRPNDADDGVNGGTFGENADDVAAGDSEFTQEAVWGETAAKQMYYLKLNNNIIAIYEEDGEFYDYAEVHTEILPDEILGELKMGMNIYGEDNLYDFLQAYSS